MFRLYLITTVFIFLATTTAAQQRMVSGYLKDSLTQLAIPGGTITNTTTKQQVQTDTRGFFFLRAAPNDLIHARAANYKLDTLRYSPLFADTITVFLAPTAVVLQNVTVESGYAKYQMDSFSRRAEFEAERGQRLNTIDRSRHEGFGLVINLDRFFKKKYHTQKKDERKFNNLEQQAYIDFRFPQQLVAFYTGLRGDELLYFMRLYTPSHEWLRQHPAREQLIGYINDRFKEYKKGNVGK